MLNLPKKIISLNMAGPVEQKQCNNGPLFKIYWVQVKQRFKHVSDHLYLQQGPVLSKGQKVRPSTAQYVGKAAKGWKKV